MSRYLQLKAEAAGYQDVSDTVKTVEKVAASKIHALRLRLDSIKTTRDALKGQLDALAPFIGIELSDPKDHVRPGARTAVVLTGDRGLVGGLYREVIKLVEGSYGRVLMVGAKGKALADEERLRVDGSLPGLADLPDAEDFNRVIDRIFKEFDEGRASSVDLIYGDFVTLAEQRPVARPFLPFRFGTEETGPPSGIPIFEPSAAKVRTALLSRYVRALGSAAVVGAKLSEFAARAVSMEHAAEKSRQLVRSITLSYFKERRRDLSQGQVQGFLTHRVI